MRAANSPRNAPGTQLVAWTSTPVMFATICLSAGLTAGTTPATSLPHLCRGDMNGQVLVDLWTPWTPVDVTGRFWGRLDSTRTRGFHIGNWPVGCLPRAVVGRSDCRLLAVPISKDERLRFHWNHCGRRYFRRDGSADLKIHIDQIDRLGAQANRADRCFGFGLNRYRIRSRRQVAE